MIDINDLQTIEKYFSENLDTPLFPILSDLYLKKGDYERAKKVCQIGLKKNPNSSVAYYILAKISLINENIKKAEKHLEKSINCNNINLSSMNLLFFVHKELNRSKAKIKKNVLNILSLDTHNQDCYDWINENYKKEKLIDVTIKKDEEKQKNGFKSPKGKNVFEKQKISKKDFKQKTKNIINSVKESIDINQELASMTLFNIYKSQGYYEQALQVLNILKGKEKNNKKIIEEINILKNLINENK